MLQRTTDEDIFFSTHASCWTDGSNHDLTNFVVKTKKTIIELQFFEVFAIFLIGASITGNRYRVVLP